MVPEQVQAGAAFLDEVVGPEWVEEMNLDQLDINSGCDCVAAQTVKGFEGGYMNAWEYAMFSWGIITPGDPEVDSELATIDQERARRLGFLGPRYPHLHPSNEEIEDGWREVIAERVATREPLLAEGA